MGEYMVRQVRGGLGHAARVARKVDAPAFAGEGDKKVVSTAAATYPRKTAGEDAALKALAKRVLYGGGRGMVVTLAVELSGVGQL
jgi:hypothetical protein